MKTYVITLSQVFPATHPRKGDKTEFKEKVLVAVSDSIQSSIRPKIHTIRANYEFWRKRFDDLYAGTACLSIRQWTGKPYCSKQVEIARLTRKDGIGIQRLDFQSFLRVEQGDLVYVPAINNKPIDYPKDCISLAHNDGLDYTDWLEWFSNYDKSKPMAIIHFTSFRY